MWLYLHGKGKTLLWKRQKATLMIFLISFFPRFISKIILNYFIFGIIHLVLTQYFRKILPLDTHLFVCISGFKKFLFFRKVCVRSKWMMPSLISFLGLFVHLNWTKFRTTFLPPPLILHSFPNFHCFSYFWLYHRRVSRVWGGRSIAGVKTLKVTSATKR